MNINLFESVNPNEIVKEGEKILQKGNIDDFGKLLHESWLEKKSLSKAKKFKNFILSKNIYYPSNGIIFMSTSLTIKELHRSIKVFKEGLKKFFKK